MKKNSGFISLYKTKENAVPQKTVVIAGLARSGTSMTAKILHNLGVNMGNNFREPIYEDRDIIDNLERDFSPEKFGKFVEQRNTEHDIWGWKRPGTLKFVDRFENVLRNPHFIIPFRDYISITNRAMIAANRDFHKYINHVHKGGHRRLINFIDYNYKSKQFPLLVFSYEKALMNNQNFIKEMADFLDIKLDDQKLEEITKLINPNDQEYLKRVSK